MTETIHREQPAPRQRNTTVVHLPETKLKGYGYYARDVKLHDLLVNTRCLSRRRFLSTHDCAIDDTANNRDFRHTRVLSTAFHRFSVVRLISASARFVTLRT